MYYFLISDKFLPQQTRQLLRRPTQGDKMGNLDDALENECLYLQAHLLSAEATEGKELSSLELYKYRVIQILHAASDGSLSRP